MIDFSEYTLTELQAMSDVLDDLTCRMSISEVMQAHLLPFHYYKEVAGAVSAAIDQQALDAADAPPAEDPEPVPDMFGWVGDALDDLCAAGEVLGSDE